MAGNTISITDPVQSPIDDMEDGDVLFGLRGKASKRFQASTVVPGDGTVGTTKLADSAVTLAKMAGGTAGVLVGFDGSGNPSEVPLATQAQAEAATNNTAPMTPLRTAQSILKNAETAAYTPPNVSVATRTIQSALREFSFAQDRGAFGTDPAANTAKLLAVCADYPYGARIIMPKGTTPFAPFTVPDYISLEWEDRNAAAALFSAATGDLITLGIGSTLRGVHLASSVTRTAGRHVFWKGNDAGLENIRFSGYFVAAEVGVASDPLSSIPVSPTMEDILLSNPSIASGTAGIVLSFFSNAWLEGIEASGPDTGTQPDAGLVVRRGDTCYVAQSNLTKHGRALLVDPTSGYSCVALTIESCTFDSAGQISSGAYVDSAGILPSGGAQVKETSIVNTWFGLSSGGNGLQANAAGGVIDGLGMSNCVAPGNYLDGFSMAGANLKNWSANACKGYGNSRIGMNITGGTVGFSVTSGHYGPEGGRPGNLGGINVAGGSASDDYIIAMNRCRGNTSFNFYDGGTGTNKIVEPNLT